MPESPRLAWQSSLFEEPGTPGVDPAFGGLQRHQLDATAWVDHVPSVSANLYRDGRDSVAWHGDRIARTVADPLVAIVSLGHPRRFLLRPRGGATRLVLEPRGGDLVVMGGSSQRGWQHTIPKAAVAGPRISVTLRHSS